MFSCTKTDNFVVTPQINTPVTPVTATEPVFTGYNVISNATELDQSYWLRGTPIVHDFFTDVFYFQQTFNNQQPMHRATSCALGDFNKDGYLDIFYPGYAYQGLYNGFTFLVWNPSTKRYDNQNLFNDKSFTHFGGNINKTVPYDLNKDGYMDFVIFDNGDEGINNSTDEPIRIVLSDGKGGYDLKEIETSETETFTKPNGQKTLIGWKKESGDVGDLNGDGIPDLLITCNVVTYIYWGINQYPYFTKTNRAIMFADNQNYGNIGNNGFGENCSNCANFAFNCVISDINKDGKNDIILGTIEDPNNNIFPTHQRILFNQGSGRFNNNGILTLPDFTNTTGSNLPENQDYIVDDLNGDGLNDIITLNSISTSSWNIFVYMQQPNGTFLINNDMFKYNITPTRTSWKPRLLYADFNNDGKKDISYIDCDLNRKNITNKTVFIRTGNEFIEKSYFDIDPYAKSLVGLINQ